MGTDFISYCCSLIGSILGWDEGIVGMQVGGERKLTLPPNMAYGKKGTDGIPKNSTLIFGQSTCPYQALLSDRTVQNVNSWRSSNGESGLHGPWSPLVLGRS